MSKKIIELVEATINALKAKANYPNILPHYLSEAEWKLMTACEEVLPELKLNEPLGRRVDEDEAFREDIEPPSSGLNG